MTAAMRRSGPHGRYGNGQKAIARIFSLLTSAESL